MRANRVLQLKEIITKRILLLDGATGTALQQKNLTAKDFGGEEFEGCNENLVLTAPHIIAEVHREYFEAGADIVETNSFGGTPMVLAEYKLEGKYFEINKRSAEIAREVADEFTKKNPLKPRFVAGSVGPTTKALTVTGGITFNELVTEFQKQAEALYEGGVDYFLVETCQDTRNIKAAIIGIMQFQKTKEVQLPIAVSVTIEATGTMLAGQTVEAIVASLLHVDLLYIGLNCATGAEFMTDHIRTLAEIAPWPISCLPNAGLPDENGKYLETPEMVAKILSRFIEKGWINILGGCCGTTKEHIRAISKIVEGATPHKPVKRSISLLSGIDLLEVTDEKRPILVGERTNSIGSKKFRDLIALGKFDEAAEIAKAQVKTGSQIIDVCLANPDRNEFEDMQIFLTSLIQKIKAPLMIDTTSTKVTEMALTYSQGKAIINSINLEEGEKRFGEIAKLAHEYGAALVVGTIDEDPLKGMAVSRERKLEIATRSFDLLTKKYNIPAEDIYFDPLVFPCASGDENYKGSAVETIEGLRLIKERYPQVKSVVGLSNVSFGLPTAGREVLNSVFLYHLTLAGLDLAIVNSEKLCRYTSLSKEEIELSENLLFNRGSDPVAAFANYFREKKVVSQSEIDTLTPSERVKYAILNGEKLGLDKTITTLLESYAPLDLINGPLMEGMKEVGKLFNENKLIVAEVLQSAEVMKAAVNLLEPFMEKKSGSMKGKFLLATVKGDVHDIGKNLVDIILTNNGFEVINLGIKITSEQLIEAYKTYKPDMIGLSGLLVKSAEQMVITAEDLSNAGVRVPILVGGAALSNKFVHKKIAPAYMNGHVFYGKDAMSGLALANQIMESDQLDQLITKNLSEREILLAQDSATVTSATAVVVTKAQLTYEGERPKAPDFERHVIKNTPVEMLYRYINPLMLYTRHLGIKGIHAKALAMGNQSELDQTPEGQKALEIYYAVEKIKSHYAKDLVPSMIYQFFNANADGDAITIYDKSQAPLKTFEFSRQQKEEGLCLSDYVLDQREGMDNVALMVVTVGKNIRALAAEMVKRGEYLDSHILQALALETAEAYAEYAHTRIRALWGHPDPVETTLEDRFKTRYRGKRYSFGYPACPNLADQEKLFDLLKPSDIGVELTEGFMMDPEASISAIVFHHPKASYFIL